MDSAGQAEFIALQNVLTGSVGLAIGLALTVWGLWKAFVQGEAGSGIIIAICGVLVTIFPGVFNTAYGVVEPLVNTLTGR